ncbi:hypothetical protein GCM10027417_30510 [Glutamicibacter endophyticus]
MLAKDKSVEPRLEKRTYSIPAVAQILGIGKARAYEMARSGELPGLLKVGNRYLVSRKVLDAFVDGELSEGSSAA